MAIFHETITTRPHEAGQDNRLKIQSICNYFEDVAGYHADQLGCGIATLLAQNLTWVLAKMRFVFHHLPDVGETLQLATWPVGVERSQFRRDFTVTSQTGDLFVSATTTWVVINQETRRIEKMPPWAHNLVPDNPPHALPSEDIRLPSADNGTSGPLFAVRLADIDQNQHVNNVRYVDFGMEAASYYLQQSGLPQRDLAGLDIIFRAESVMGDSICTRTLPHPEKKDALIHSFTRQQNGQELARVCTYLK